MKKLLFILLILLMASPSFATHYMGGEITWECLPNGNYRFTMKLYRECYVAGGSSAATFGNTEIMNTTVPGLSSITMTRISLTDISPVCNSNPLFTPKIYCPGMATGNANMGALQENIYTSDATYPNGVTLNGVPPAVGWMFYHTSCCRNPCTNILNASSLGWRLRAIMYPYNGQNANPCFDSSPQFAEKPSTVIGTGYPFTYNHNAFDPNLDSLVYEWAQPLNDGTGAPIVGYAAGYSYTSPLPGPSFNPNNVAATVDPNTGEIAFTSFTQGAFVTVVKVTAFRCGIKIAEIFREMQVVLLAGGANNPPNVEPPFQDPNTMLYTLYNDTVYAGELVTFSVTGTDFELMPDGMTPQTLRILASGGQFGAGYTNTAAGCAYPPCATLNPPPPVVAQFGVITNFSWQTSCEHISTDAGCGSMTNTYTFLIKVMDDFCPAPAIKFNTVTIVVLAIPPIDPPEPRCVETLANGDVQITWVPPDDPDSTFNSYHVFYSPNIGFPFQVVDSIFNYNQTSWIHSGANGNNQNGYYYIKTRSGCFGKYWSTTTSDTITNILLNVSNSGTGVAQLNWNATHDPILPTNSPWYLIFRDPGIGTWSLIDSTMNLNYNDTIVFCDADVRYQIRQRDESGCFSISNIDGDIFQDVTPPDIPVFDFVTVDQTTQQSYLEWQASLATDVVGYIVYRFDGAIWSPLDTVSILNYQDVTSDPTTGYEAYRVASIDSCGNTSPMGLEHRTIYLTTQKDICDDMITLTWTPYINLAASLANYEILYNIDGGAYQILDVVASSTTQYVHTGLIDSTQYCYIIRAVNDDGLKTPQSNIQCENAIKPFQPQFAYIRYVTVVNSSYVEIAMYTDTTAKVAGYRLEKSMDGGVTFGTIADIPPSIDPFVYHDDYQAIVDQFVYTYRFIVRDSCDIDAITSNLASTILLSGEQGTDLFSNIIDWTEYEGWPTGVELYDVFRGATSTMFLNIAQVPVGSGSYLDVFPDDVVMSEGKITYYVEAAENPGNPYGFVETSKSNIIHIPQPPRVYVPNAFTPGGLNPTFKPMTIFVDHENYYFGIYNRWGQQIFETTDIAEGWDGTFEGNLVRADTYVYILKVQFADGRLFEKRGIVTIIL